MSTCLLCEVNNQLIHEITEARRETGKNVLISAVVLNSIAHFSVIYKTAISNCSLKEKVVIYISLGFSFILSCFMYAVLYDGVVT